MKRNKKHNFMHKDPEKETPLVQKNSKTDKLPADNTSEFFFIKKDLKMTTFLIGIFVVLIFALYFIQTETGLLAPLLNKFGL